MPLAKESPHTIETPADDRLRTALRHDEETVNSITHGIGFVLSLAGAVWLMNTVIGRGNLLQCAGCGVFAASLVAVYAASTLSHVFRRPRLRRLFRIVDQAFIFLLIAGTYTGFAFTYLDKGPWWILTTLMWVIAWSGFVSKLVFAHRVESVSTGLHVVMGWLPVLCIKPITDAAPGASLWWMLAGGICYTAGTIFLSRDERVPYFHAVWHLAVIAGSACHYWAILQWCSG
ncbi:MAG TPA: hemolysin III family protein [Pirellulales bacterium]|jgi:hemolysin III|nr:hemolysin III family protein [Pirellulales bacterium]